MSAPDSELRKAGGIIDRKSAPKLKRVAQPGTSISILWPIHLEVLYIGLWTSPNCRLSPPIFCLYHQICCLSLRAGDGSGSLLCYQGGRPQAGLLSHLDMDDIHGIVANQPGGYGVCHNHIIGGNYDLEVDRSCR